MAKARGIANNNPGNLKLTDKQWPGEVARSENTDKPFKQFKTMNAGIQALMVNLLAYFKSGNNTITKILDKWDPKPDDNTPYKKFVSKSTGYGAYKVLAPGSEQITRLTRAMIDFENGTNNITNSQIQEAWDTLGLKQGKAAAIRTPGKKKDNVLTGVLTGMAIMGTLFILDDGK